MKNKEEIITEEGFVLKFYPRETKNISINISVDTLEVIEKKAKERDMSVSALLKFYINQGLREDLTDKESSELAIKRFRNRKKVKEEKEDVDLVA
jgi:post-segregation antitoxin (ccd killing protein)